ncbi:regulator of G-protein signaling 12-like isoform X2 [Myxocyprinus asiaticus]|uniref:regulator of G-protein signaling 12-like isoform X2 n=1 Tax=Myxocyprinus asiaticus TaxID=70543 RepID=UPI002221AF43|nr:regulator of G-protein signaling 12-like isoform X2 [Myxocyprinus asiaticus]
MRVLKPAESAMRHLHCPPSLAVYKVEMERSRAGYGFTISGQAPCVLHGIIKGSPAYSVGLRPGDRILRVNGTDVSEASHEVVVKLIGTSSHSLCLLVTSGDRPPINSSSSDEELGCQSKGKLPWLNPGKKDPFSGQLKGRDMTEPMLHSVGSFDTIFEISDQSSISTSQERLKKQRPLSEPDMSYWVQQVRSKSHPDSLSQNDTPRVVSGDSVFSDLQSLNDFALESNILNVAMIVGYINSMELELMTSHSEEEALQAIRECVSQIGIEQKTHSLVLMRIKCNCVQLCDDRDVVLASYPAESLALCVICTDDSRFFGLVSVDLTKSIGAGAQTGTPLKTLCHVFFIDPELYDHKEHQSIMGHFGIPCTPDPDTQSCLEFPQTPHSILNFVSVLYTDMGDYIEKLRLKLDGENPDEGQQNTQNSGSGSDSGIGNASPEDRDSLIGQLSFTSPNTPNPPPNDSQHRNSAFLKPDRRCLLSEPLSRAGQPVTPECVSAGADGSAFTLLSLSVQSNLPFKHRSSQRRHSIGLKARWQKSSPSSTECLVERDDEGHRNKSDTLPPAMEQIPTLRYKPLEDFKHHQRMNFTPQLKMTCRFFSRASKHKDGENKESRFWALKRGRSSVRRPSSPAKRLSLAHSLNDLESAASAGECSGVMHHDCGSVNSLASNGSLLGINNHRRLSERCVALWAVSFERLLQDPVGVRYFSEFLKKEFSEENILFWQACESFSQVPEHDKKQLSQKAKEIYNCFLSSKATMPVNIDSQAQLADDVLTAPQPNMFKQPQLQIFNLMKMDSYARFLKSTLYQECMLADVEGKPLPDPCPIPCSPAPSKHSFTSDLSTPKKENRKPKPGSSRDDLREKPSEKKNGFFPWYRYPSIGKGQKKKEATDLPYNCNGRRESQGSMSSGASQELNTSCSGGKNECELRNSGLVWEKDKERCSRTCTVTLPDGSSCCVPLRQGASIRQVLLELCQKQHINLAAVDLFLTGGEKPLVLDQDSITLSSRELRLEKRTLFRLDLVPINRSVGLKAKPTKPVTEVLRPVVAKYGLHLGDLVARISGETEVLDLGVPISNLDGLRVVLERADPAKDKSKTSNFKTPAAKKALPKERDNSSAGKPLKGNGEDKQSQTAASERRKGIKSHKDEAEEFFELLSRAQSSRVDDQRGLLRKEDLVLPDFLRVNPDPEPQPPACSTPTSHKPVHTTTTNPQPPKPSFSNGHPHTHSPESAPFTASFSPILRSSDPQGQEEEGLGDLTLVGEGDITSPNSTLLPPPPSSPPPYEGSLPEANFTLPTCIHTNPGTEGGKTCTLCITNQREQCLSSVSQMNSAVLDKGLSVEGVTLEDSFEGYAAELRQCQNKMRNGIYSFTEASRPLSGVLEVSESETVEYKATFV